MCCHGSCFLTPRVGQGPAVILFPFCRCFFCFRFVVLVPVLVYFLEGGEEKGTVAEVRVRRGVCARVCVSVCAHQSRGGTGVLCLVGEEVSSPKVDVEDTTHGSS